jgi:hypothetical protein
MYNGTRYSPQQLAALQARGIMVPQGGDQVLCENVGFAPGPAVSRCVGRPAILIGEENLAAAETDTLQLTVDTGARFKVDKLVAILDRSPLHSIAVCQVDVLSITLTSEMYGSEEDIIVGAGNLLCVFGTDGALNYGEYLGASAQLRQGTALNIQLRNNDANNAHRVTIAAHGELVRTQEAQQRQG